MRRVPNANFSFMAVPHIELSILLLLSCLRIVHVNIFYWMITAFRSKHKKSSQSFLPTTVIAPKILIIMTLHSLWWHQLFRETFAKHHANVCSQKLKRPPSWTKTGSFNTLRATGEGRMEKLGSAEDCGGVSSPLCSWRPPAGCAGPLCRAASPPSSADTSQTQPGPEGGGRMITKRHIVIRGTTRRSKRRILKIRWVIVWDIEEEMETTWLHVWLQC